MYSSKEWVTCQCEVHWRHVSRLLDSDVKAADLHIPIECRSTAVWIHQTRAIRRKVGQKIVTGSLELQPFQASLLSEHTTVLVVQRRLSKTCDNRLRPTA